MAGWEERALEWLTARALDALARGDAVDPLALTLLVRRYCAGGRAELADALGPALASAAERDIDAHDADATDWLILLTESCAVSDDPHLRAAAARLLARTRERWAARADAPDADDAAGADDVESAMRSIGACLSAAELIDPREIVPIAIDEIERIVGAAYRPGRGIGHRVRNPDAERSRLGDHVRAAAALLTAYELTARLPYAMLAEELIQFARRTLWDEEGGGFRGQAGADAKPFVLNCEAACVLGRLAALHDMRAYRDAAVLAPDAHYEGDAVRILASLEPSYRDRGADAAAFGLALTRRAGRS